MEVADELQVVEADLREARSRLAALEALPTPTDPGSYKLWRRRIADLDCRITQLLEEKAALRRPPPVQGVFQERLAELELQVQQLTARMDADDAAMQDFLGLTPSSLLEAIYRDIGERTHFGILSHQQVQELLPADLPPTFQTLPDSLKNMQETLRNMQGGD